MRVWGNRSGRKSRSHIGRSSGRPTIRTLLLHEPKAWPLRPVIAIKLRKIGRSAFEKHSLRVPLVYDCTYSALIGPSGTFIGVRS